ncbi:hypothetical protein [Planktothrix mougeotii]|uniref:Uncharacterized protein n=1 Tax=Planktothrix mougeotii LEGE 06226 TaxID=1828728 RepID=A0ABR9UBK1_9CYAN|nr:hypothetical protein [Planktothrix mougeotii]MBE9143833.1 hypothetical protein [Planktothrix mougeotii LEGE 06226]
MLKKFRKINYQLLNLFILSIGVIFTLASLMFDKNNNEDLKTILISIGTSIISSSIIVFLSSRYLIKESETNELINEWRLSGMYLTRAEMNRETDDILDKCQKQIDIIAFGLKSLREEKSSLIKKKVKAGIHIRILTINPKSKYLAQREKDEQEIEGQIKNTIYELENWVAQLKAIASHPSNIELKYYNCLPLDFYCRVDDNVFLGPYMYGKSSQKTFSYEFRYGGLGFDYWTRYFEELWSKNDWE